MVSIATLNRGENLYIAGLANGSVKILSTAGQLLAEISSHSRIINALTCHPTRSVFATASDDTFVHVYEVVGDKLDKLDVNLIVGSKVSDYMLCGLAFGGDNNSSLVAAPYDFKTLIVWNNLL